MFEGFGVPGLEGLSMVSGFWGFGLSVWGRGFMNLGLRFEV